MSLYVRIYNDRTGDYTAHEITSFQPAVHGHRRLESRAERCTRERRGMEAEAMKTTDAEFLRTLADELRDGPGAVWGGVPARLRDIADHLDALEPKLITEPCLCDCPRCQLFPIAHDVTHVDCCGRQAKLTPEAAESAYYEHQVACKKGCNAIPPKLCAAGGNLLQVVGYRVGANPGDGFQVPGVGYVEGKCVRLSDFVKKLDEACAHCGAQVFESPSGIVCTNGHGGEGVIP